MTRHMQRLVDMLMDRSSVTPMNTTCLNNCAENGCYVGCECPCCNDDGEGITDTLHRVITAAHDGWSAEADGPVYVYRSLEAAEAFIFQLGYDAYSDGTLITYNVVEYVIPPF